MSTNRPTTSSRLGRTLRLLLGVRAIAGAAGLDPREVIELVGARDLRALNGRLIGRQIARAETSNSGSIGMSSFSRSPKPTSRLR